MKKLRKPLLILIAFLGSTILGFSLYLMFAVNRVNLTFEQILLIGLTGLLFLLLGLAMLRSKNGGSSGIKQALMNIERILAPLFNQVSKWRFLKNPKAVDALCYALFIVFAALFTLGRWNGNTPFIFVYDDGGTIASMAASYDHPGSFAGDIIIGDTPFTNNYRSAFIPLIRILSRYTGNYGLTFIVFLPIFILLQAFGVYTLGKKFLENRVLAFFLTVFSFTPIYATNWDYWGITTDVLTRQAFQCLVIYVLILAVSWKDQPKRWIWIMLALGLLAYIYPVSSIPVAFAVWLGLVLFFPKKYTRRNKVNISIGIGMAYIIALLPVALFFSGGTFSYSTFNKQQAIQTLYQVYADLLNMGSILTNLFKSLLWSGLLPLALAGTFFILCKGDRESKERLSLFGTWVLGVSFISLFVVGIEHYIEQQLGLIPFQTEMVRGIRYLPFFIELIVFLALALLYQKSNRTLIPNVMQALVILFAAVYTLGLRSNILKDIDYPGNEIKCLLTGHITCQSNEEKAAIDLFVHAKQILPPHTNVLAIPPTTYPYESAIRYYLLEPSGLSYSDINRIINIDPVTTQYIIDLQTEINQEIATTPPESRLQIYLDHASELRTDVFIIALVDFRGVIPESAPVLYRNDTFALVDARSNSAK